MFKKRGLTHVDWVISLALFLIFLAWFFVFLRPTGIAPEDPSTLMNRIILDLHDELSVEVPLYPLFLESPYAAQSLPIVFRNPFPLHNLSTTFPLVYEDPYVLLISNHSKGTNILWFAEGQPLTIQTDVAFNYSRATTQGLGVLYDNATLVSLSYGNTVRIDPYEVHVNGNPVRNVSVYARLTPLAYIRREHNALYNTTTFITKGRMISVVDPLPFTNISQYNLTFAMTLHNYPHYFSNAENGTINESMCTSLNTTAVDFYTGREGVSFMFSNVSIIRFCGDVDEDTITINADMTILLQHFTYGVIFYNSSVNRSYEFRSPLTVSGGYAQPRVGFSREKLAEFQKRPYASVQGYFNIRRDLSIRINNSPTIANVSGQATLVQIGNPDPQVTANIYTRTGRCVLMNASDDLEPCTYEVKIW
ncbi:hypothetical protein J4464_04110 [Candidatus Woesearchaeota archaeon]|nr:hypothetical protein [Candidatus Woesearchaeota archaeon]